MVLWTQWSRIVAAWRSACAASPRVRALAVALGAEPALCAPDAAAAGGVDAALRGLKEMQEELRRQETAERLAALRPSYERRGGPPRESLQQHLEKRRAVAVKARERHDEVRERLAERRAAGTATRRAKAAKPAAATEGVTTVDSSGRRLHVNLSERDVSLTDMTVVTRTRGQVDSEQRRAAR